MALFSSSSLSSFLSGDGGEMMGENGSRCSLIRCRVSSFAEGELALLFLFVHHYRFWLFLYVFFVSNSYFFIFFALFPLVDVFRTVRYTSNHYSMCFAKHTQCISYVFTVMELYLFKEAKLPSREVLFLSYVRC